MSNRKKDELLGEPHGTATGRLRKALLFKYVKLAGHDICYRCKRKIEVVADFSVEHTVAWQAAPDPKAAFMALDDIAFSHLRCNSGAARSWNKKYETAEERRVAHNRHAVESKARHYSPEKRRQAYLDGRW